MATRTAAQVKTNIIAIITSVIGGIILLVVEHKTRWFTANDADRIEETRELLIEKVNEYYKDLITKDFDASDYFARDVERFFQLKNTTPQAINENYNQFFKREFLNLECRPDFETMTLIKEGDVYVAEFEINTSFYLRSKGKTKIGRYLERIKINEKGKFTYLHDFKILKEGWK